MRHICAWCKEETAPPDGASDDDLISHGMCVKCSELLIAGMEGMNIRGHKSGIGVRIRKGM